MLHSCLQLMLPLLALGSTWDIEGEDTVELEWDDSGYIFYCPCMGRFGNQAEYLLGAMGFAKGLNRTLILPPWRSDRMLITEWVVSFCQRSIPFDDYFLVSPLRDYHRVVLAGHFMRHFAADHWPPGKRYGWCFRGGDQMPKVCGMKEGQPFGPFWDSLGVDFDDYVFHNAGFDEYYYPQWRDRYPPDKYPVIALKGAPARFPVQEKFVSNHQFLDWSNEIEDESSHYIQKTFSGEKFIGIHLRNDIDWNRACQHLKDSGSTNYMSSAQCYGYENREVIPLNVCLPSRTDIIKKLQHVSKEYEIKNVFVATDKDPLLSIFKDLLPDMKFHHLDPYRPQIDLAVLGKSDVFIGNCISSFSAFVSRHRAYHHVGKPSHYWAVN